MNPIGLLHNAARHYCIQRAAHWHRQYAELGAAGRQRTSAGAGSWDYTDEAWGIFPRYQILAAIQRDVEQYVPAGFHSLADLRTMLIAAGETAQVAGTKFDKLISVQAVEEERRQFLEFVDSADERDLAALPELPFRRVLAAAENDRLDGAFCSRWGKWYGGCVTPADAATATVTLHELAMEAPGAYERLRQLIVDHGITRLIELREWGNSHELDVSDASFTYNGAEGFWTSGDMAWMVYASHESSITFGGGWLIEGMRQLLPRFDHFIYRGWDLAAYPTPPDQG